MRLLVYSMNAETFLRYAQASRDADDCRDALPDEAFTPSPIPPQDASMLVSASKTLEVEDDDVCLERRYLKDEDINEFVPSKETACWWLQCNHNEYPPELATKSIKLSRLRTLYRNKVQSDLNHDELKQKAIESSNYTSGKWILKTTEKHVDDVWRLLASKVRDATLLGGEPFCVKCSSKRLAQDNPHCYYTLCLYVAHGWTRRDVTMRIRDVLFDLNVDRLCVQPLYFKPDLYTLLPLSGHTYQWIDRVDTPYWFEHWNGAEVHFLR